MDDCPGSSGYLKIARAGQAPQVVVEAAYGWCWAADVLAEAGAEVHLAHPLEVKAFTYRRVKNDERDAADLADLLRMGRLPEAWIALLETRELREVTRYRHKLIEMRTSLKDQVHGVLSRCPAPASSAASAAPGSTACACRSRTRARWTRCASSWRPCPARSP